MIRHRRLLPTLSLALALALLGAACGDDDGATTVAEEVTEAAEPDEEGGVGATTPAPDDGGEEDPPDDGGEEAAMDGDLGDPDGDGVYVGTGGFEIDTGECPSDWDNTQGITEDSIKLGSSMPQSGPLAGFGLIAVGMESYFDHVNSEGGIDGRTIEFVTKDDSYEAARTVENVDELLTSENVAALVTVLGTPNNLAIVDDMNDSCVPQLLNATGAPTWGDPVNYPWTTGQQIDYATEPAVWAQNILEEFPDGATVAELTFNNDFGAFYEKGFRAAIEGTNLEIVGQEKHDPTAPNLINEITTLASTDADVLLLETSGQFCTQAMDEVAKSSWDPLIYMHAGCASISQFFDPLPAPAGEGVRIVNSYKDVNDPRYADDEFVQFYRETLESQDLDPTQTTYATGWLFALYAEEILKEASALPGGLNRANIILANRMIDYEHPLLLEGVTARMNGLEDAYLIEGGVIQEFFRNDAGEGGYEDVTDVVSLEGEVGAYGTSGLAENYPG